MRLGPLPPPQWAARLAAGRQISAQAAVNTAAVIPASRHLAALQPEDVDQITVPLPLGVEAVQSTSSPSKRGTGSEWLEKENNAPLM